MKLLRSERGASLMETLVTVGILGLIAYFVVGLLKTGTMGQKQLQAQDDARVVTENMATVLADDIACENTLGGPLSTVNPASTTSIALVKNKDNNVVYETGKVFGNRTLKLLAIKVGGPASETDQKTGIKKWAPVGSPAASGTAFVQVDWEQTGTDTKQASGPTTLTRFFLLKATELNSNGTIKKCAAQAASATSGFWSLNVTSNAIYNTNGSGAGGVGIGTAMPMGVFDVFAGSGHSLLVDAFGHVGIGLLNPTSLLHVKGSDPADNIVFEKNGKKLTLDANLSAGNIQAQISSPAGMGLSLKADAANMVLASTGNIGINEPAPAYALHVNGDVQAANFISTSDARLKTDVCEIDGLESVLRLRGVSFRWKSDGSPALGLIAQEVEKVLPEVVSTNPNSGLKAIKYEALLAPVIEAVKKVYSMSREALSASGENSARISALEMRLELQAKQIEELRARLKEKAR